MNMNYTDRPAEQGNVVQQLFFKYLPYWYIFLALLVLGIAGAWVYLKMKVPLYESRASILIRDEKRGTEESKMEEMLNVFTGKNIVENELEVLKSNALLTDVVTNLRLYAPVMEEYGWKNSMRSSAYHASPVIVELRDSLTKKGAEKVYFTVDDVVHPRRVRMGSQEVNVGQWFNSPWGKMRFAQNPEYWKGVKHEGSRFYFKLIRNSKAALDVADRMMVAPTSKQASVVVLRVRDEVPERGEAILSEVIAAYNLNSIKKKNETASNTLRFIEERLGKVTNELDSVEAGIEKYRNNSGIVNISEQSNQYLRSIEQNDQELNKMKLQMAVLDQVEGYINNNQGGTMSPSTFNIEDPGLNTMLDKLHNKELEYEKLKQTTAENNPLLVGVREEIEKMRRNINDNVRNQRRSISAGQNYLARVSGQYNSMLNSIPEKEKELVEVSRQRNIKSDIYSFLLQKKEEATYALKSSVADSYVVEKPISGTQPVSPKKPFILLLAVILPLALGVSVVGAKEFLNNKILYRDDIHALTSFPVIGEVVYDKEEADPLTRAGGRSFQQEQFRQIRTSFRNMTRSLGGRVMVTSSIEGEGKSFIATNFAISLARSGKRVALLELDLYQPAISRLLQVEAEKGITDMLLGEAEPREIVCPTAFENLSLIPAGNLVETPSELLLNGKLEVLLNYLEAMYDFLIIDTPPVRLVSDAYEIAQLSNFVLFVVRHDYTPKVNIKALDKEMHAHQVNEVAVVFNGVKQRGIGKYSYGYGYGYGYDDRVMYNEYGKRKGRKIA